MQCFQCTADYLATVVDFTSKLLVVLVTFFHSVGPKGDMTLSIMILSITTISITTFRIMTFRIMTFSLNGL